LNFKKINLFSFVISALVFISPIELYGQIPSYYNSVDFSQSPNAVRVQLSMLISDTHVNLIPYTSSNTDTWDILRISDLNTDSSSDVLLMYGYNNDDSNYLTDRTRNRYSTCHSVPCYGLWNREHVFAKSLANPSLQTGFPGPGTDVHNLRPADYQMNSYRGNRLFSDGSGTAFAQGSYFYPGDEWKGDVARIIMYMYLRYPDQCEAINSADGNVFSSNAGEMPELFLDWNVQDPVSEFEINRNNVISSFQGNRNPFIDNPYLATYIWNGPAAEDTWNLLGEQEFNFEEIQVYPTVVSSTINISNNLDLQLNYKIINTMGLQVQSGYTMNNIVPQNISKGIYILQLRIAEQTKNFKIIIL
jgi:endonuclease I